MICIELMTEEEMQIMKRVKERSEGRTNKCVKWLPLAWSVNLLNEMKRRKFIGILMRTYITILKSFSCFQMKEATKSF